MLAAIQTRMPMPTALFKSSLASLTLLRRGKVRDIYAVDDQHLLIVASDRLSAFDVVLPNPIPQKGVILTRMSNFWFKWMQDIVPNHLVDKPLNTVLSDEAERASIVNRAVLVKRLKPLPVEAIVRGYIAGSGWVDYQRTGKICGIELPSGLQQAERLPHTLYTPSSKAEVGDHDENIDFAQTVELLGIELATQIRDISITLYERARDYAVARGIIIADTKFEFGLDDEGQLILMDEILTPDSSRFWEQSHYQIGTSPASFDKQFVRDYLNSLDWDKTPPAPALPDNILQQTAEKYREAERRLLTSPV